jgi:hypothetical protein
MVEPIRAFSERVSTCLELCLDLLNGNCASRGQPSSRIWDQTEQPLLHPTRGRLHRTQFVERPLHHNFCKLMFEAHQYYGSIVPISRYSSGNGTHK